MGVRTQAFLLIELCRCAERSAVERAWEIGEAEVAEAAEGSAGAEVGGVAEGDGGW